MGLTKDQVEKLRDLGMSFHDIAQIAKVPTPVIAQIGLYGKQPDMADFAFDFAGVLASKTKEAAKEEPMETPTEDSKMKEEPKTKGK